MEGSGDGQQFPQGLRPEFMKPWNYAMEIKAVMAVKV
jgi:hypothetical protein